MSALPPMTDTLDRAIAATIAARGEPNARLARTVTRATLTLHAFGRREFAVLLADLVMCAPTFSAAVDEAVNQMYERGMLDYPGGC